MVDNVYFVTSGFKCSGHSQNRSSIATSDQNPLPSGGVLYVLTKQCSLEPFEDGEGCGYEYSLRQKTETED